MTTLVTVFIILVKKVENSWFSTSNLYTLNPQTLTHNPQ